MIRYFAADKSREVGKIQASDAREMAKRLEETCRDLGVSRLWIMSRIDAGGEWWTPGSNLPAQEES